MEEKTISQKEKEVIIARLEVDSSEELVFSIGLDDKSFSREELIEEINNDTEVGKKFVESQFEFLRALKDGSLMEALTTQ